MPESCRVFPHKKRVPAPLSSLRIDTFLKTTPDAHASAPSLFKEGSRCLRATHALQNSPFDPREGCDHLEQ